MRTLETNELANVSGGTFGLLSCLLGGLFTKKIQIAKPVCEPKCDPKPKKNRC